MINGSVQGSMNGSVESLPGSMNGGVSAVYQRHEHSYDRPSQQLSEPKDGAVEQKNVIIHK